jgi:hypothetical protein
MTAIELMMRTRAAVTQKLFPDPSGRDVTVSKRERHMIDLSRGVPSAKWESGGYVIDGIMIKEAIARTFF